MAKDEKTANIMPATEVVSGVVQRLLHKACGILEISIRSIGREKFGFQFLSLGGWRRGRNCCQTFSSHLDAV